MTNIDAELRRQILCRRGQNHRLAEELIEKLSLEGRQSLLRILLDAEREAAAAKRNLNAFKRMGVSCLLR